jgi:hypothetical protein
MARRRRATRRSAAGCSRRRCRLRGGRAAGRYRPSSLCRRRPSPPPQTRRLWSDEGATIDAVGRSRVLEVRVPPLPCRDLDESHDSTLIFNMSLSHMTPTLQGGGES